MQSKSKIPGTDQATKARQFLDMHRAQKLLLLPNAWDAGSAKIFVQAGFQAIATTSSGIEFSGNLSSRLERRFEQMLVAVANIIQAVDAPVTADMEAGYGKTATQVGKNMLRVIETGAVGVNIEDSTDGFEVAKRERLPLKQYPIAEAVERIRAAREAANTTKVHLIINARTDTFIIGGHGKEALDDAIKRGNAFLKAGADCIFIPYAIDEKDIATLAREIDGPINILGGPKTPPIAKLQKLGVARVTVGGSIARAAMLTAQKAATELRDAGTYSFSANVLSYDESVELLRG